MPNFWKNLSTPFLVLAPMDDVTDIVFREIIADLRPPQVFFTEFANADGLNSAGKDIVAQKLKYTEKQRKIVAQIWGTNPDNIYKAAQLVSKLGFDGVDINMGCPVHAVVKKGAGAGTIGNYKLASEIIIAAKKGAKDTAVSIKTRLGIDRVISAEWIPFLLEQKIDALTLHGRIAEQMSTGLANWHEIGKAVVLRNKISPNTIVIGNGDIKSYSQAMQMHEQYKVDGIMIGRGIFTNPWVFENDTNHQKHSKADYLTVLKKHLDLFDTTWGDSKNFAIMKKYFKMYINNFHGANSIRQKFMDCKTILEAQDLLATLV